MGGITAQERFFSLVKGQCGKWHSRQKLCLNTLRTNTVSVTVCNLYYYVDLFECVKSCYKVYMTNTKIFNNVIVI